MLQSKQVTSQEMLEELKAFLQLHRLPYSDVQLTNSFYLVNYQDDELVGCVGMELYQSHALLRSLAVSEKLRKQGLGRKLVSEILKEAKKEKMEGVFLLTETAAPFFLQLGFADVDRKEAPDGIKSSSEFSHVCPSTARFMFAPAHLVV